MSIITGWGDAGGEGGRGGGVWDGGGGVGPKRSLKEREAGGSSRRSMRDVEVDIERMIMGEGMVRLRMAVGWFL